MPAKTPTDRYGVVIDRAGPIQLYPFERYFRGFASIPPIQRLFSTDAKKVLRAQKVEFYSGRFGYMGTSDEDGHLLINRHHLRTAPFRTVYLDLVHELCHVKQFRAGRPLFYPKLSYVDAPSEIEAYRFTAEEGRRIGMSEKELFDYLHTFWLSPAEHRRLARHSGVAVPPSRPARKKKPA